MAWSRQARGLTFEGAQDRDQDRLMHGRGQSRRGRTECQIVRTDRPPGGEDSDSRSGMHSAR